MKNIVKILILVFVVMLFLDKCDFGLGLSEEDKKRKAEYESSAKEIATEYIVEKYHFNARITDADAITQRDSIGPMYLTGDVFVTMKYNNTKFYVKVDFDNGDKKVIGDTYQNDLIKKDSINKLKELFKQEPIYFLSSLDNDNKEYMEYYYDYYDGKNIEKFFIPFRAGFINNTVVEDDSKIISELQNLINGRHPGSNQVEILNYKSKSAYEKGSIEKTKYNLLISYIYLKDIYYSHTAKDIRHIIIDINDKNDITLVTYNNNNSKYMKSIDYSIEPIDENAIYGNSRHDSSYKIIVNAIKLTDKNSRYIYLKKDDYKKYDEIRGINYCLTDQSFSYDDFIEIGDYYYISFSINTSCDNPYYVIEAK